MVKSKITKRTAIYCPVSFLDTTFDVLKRGRVPKVFVFPDVCQYQLFDSVRNLICGKPMRVSRFDPFIIPSDACPSWLVSIFHTALLNEASQVTDFELDVSTDLIEWNFVAIFNVFYERLRHVDVCCGFFEREQIIVEITGLNFPRGVEHTFRQRSSKRESFFKVNFPHLPGSRKFKVAPLICHPTKRTFHGVFPTRNQLFAHGAVHLR